MRSSQRRFAIQSIAITGLILRKPYKLVAVALANKMTRIIWALLTKGGVYKKSPVAISA